MEHPPTASGTGRTTGGIDTILPPRPTPTQPDGVLRQSDLPALPAPVPGRAFVYGRPGLEHASRRFGGNRARAARLGLFIRPRWDAESAARAVSDLVERLYLGSYPTQRQFVEAHASGLYRAIANRLGGHEAMAARLGLRPAHRRR